DHRVVHREADEAARMGRHEVDEIGCDELGGEHEVALVLAILVVDQDHHAAGADLVQRALDSFDGGAHRIPPRSFSTCLASRSVSRFTASPMASLPSVVSSRVCGMIATEKVSASTAFTVSETPASPIEPFSTMYRSSAGGVRTTSTRFAPR